MALSECNTTTDLHNQELVKHGDPSFPIACYHDDLTDLNVPLHWHEEWEFAVASEGISEFIVDNKHITLEEGNGIFINSKALHAVENRNHGYVRLYSIVFHPRLIGGNTDSLFWQTLVHPLMENCSTRFLPLHSDVDWESETISILCEAWHAVVEDRDDYENTVRFLISKAMRLIVRNSDFSVTGMSQQELLNADRIRTMLEYIEAHYFEDLTIDMIAGSISSSSSVCLRCFHQMLNTSPMQYVKQLRLRKASEQLHVTKKSAKEIALDCGFNDISYFTKAFRETYGCTPAAYRKQNFAD